MNSLEGIIAANRAADKKHQDQARKAGLDRTKQGESAAAKYHDKQIKQDKSGRLAR